MDSREPVSVVIAEDNPALQALLEARLWLDPDVRVVGACSDGVAAVELALDESADVIVLDEDLPGVPGLRAAELIQACAPKSEPILLIAEADAPRAAAKGLRVVNKLASADLVDQILEAAEDARARPARPVKTRVAQRVLTGIEAQRKARGRTAG